MFLVGLLQWWYGAGWKQLLARMHSRLAGVYDYFSIDLLARTLVAPFRQISAGKVQGSLQVQWRAFVDRLVSRFIGGIVRLAMIITGIISLFIFAIMNILASIIWLIMPMAPALGVAIWLIGWVPWRP